MFNRVEAKPGHALTFTFDGEPVSATAGDTVAAALLLHGETVFRQHPVSGDGRGPWCMMGACYECVVIVGNRTVQACMTRVTQDLEVARVDSAAQPVQK